ncbi:hypothetical protein BDP27DRAFT_1212188, partial [Rhodocollybia butyracea]
MSDSVLERFEQPSESVNTTSLNDLEPCTRLPTSAELGALLSLPLLDETGQIALFGDILNTSDKPDGTTVIVLFIRHFWCPLDQDYVQEVRDLLQRLSNGKEELPEVIIVSNGSSTLISKYQEIFDLPGEKGSELKVRMYTDPTCQTYSVLGCIDTGEAFRSHSYIKHTSVIGGIATVILRAINHKMPLWEKGGAIKQLGGEFVCGLKVDCMYAHRMQNTHDHTSFGDVLKIA